MPAPEALACRRNRLVAALVHHGALPRSFRLAKACAKRPTHRVRFHVVAAGMGVWLVAETCAVHRDELARLDHRSWSVPISP